MPSFQTTYMGLTLQNPIVIASSGLTNSLEKIIQLEKKGVGAIVLKSLFEEQINNEVSYVIDKDLQHNNYPEAGDYIANYLRENTVQKYLEFLREVKHNVSIPVIASINCVSSEEWISFAKELKAAGADAIEINAFIMPTDRKESSNDVEYRYLDILTEVKKAVKIPVAMKIGNHFTNLVGFVDRLYANGASSVVMFNRFWEPDINVEDLTISNGGIYSTPADIRQSLRWVGIVSGKVKNIDIAASTGVHDGESLVKQLLAGAKVAQVCSTLYLNGFSQIDEMNDYLKQFMLKWNFKSIEEFRGRLNYTSLPSPALYERSQFMKYFSNHNS